MIKSIFLACLCIKGCSGFFNPELVKDETKLLEDIVEEIVLKTNEEDK
jgi:hypothetical protein